MTIETVSESNFERVLPLIGHYQEFYQRVCDEGANRRHFGQLLGGQSPMGVQFVAIDASGQALGFATLYFLPSSLGACLSCVLNDLFTLPSARGQGVGRALIAHCRQQARLRGYAALEWQTAPDNEPSQRLYDKLGASRESWLHYRWPTE